MRKARAFLQGSLGYLFAAACLLWVLHGVNLGELAGQLTIRNWTWVAIAIAADVLSYVSQGWRWSMLLSPVGNISPLRSTQAIYSGLFVNEVMPMRLGEALRAYLAARWLSIRVSAIIPSIAVERLADGIWLALAVCLCALFVPLPANLVKATVILVAVVILATLAMLLSGSNFLTRGLGKIRASGHVEVAFGVSSLIVVLQSFAFWSVTRAYGLSISFLAGAAVFLLVHLGTAIPNAPANVGSYQFFTVLGLIFFGIDKTVAAGFSVVVFLVLTIPLWILGFIALSRAGMNMAAVRSELSNLRRETQKAPHF